MERLAGFDRDTVALAVQLRCTIPAAAAQSYPESLALLRAFAEEEQARARFEAALHDKKLRA